MAGDNALVHEQTVLDSIPGPGFPKSRGIDLFNDFKATQAGDDVPNSGTGNWQRHVIDLGAISMGGLIADATSAASDILYLRETIPDDYAEEVDKLRLVLTCRKLFTSGDNADLALVGGGSLHGRSRTDSKALTDVTHTFASVVDDETADTAWTDWEEAAFAFDGEGFKAGGIAEFTFHPNEAVGTNGEIQIIGARLEYFAHATIRESNRHWADAS